MLPCTPTDGETRPIPDRVRFDSVQTSVSPACRAVRCCPWLPVATWIMPRIAGAPTWSENPAWYMSSLPMSVVIAILFRIARRLVDRVHRRSRSV